MKVYNNKTEKIKLGQEAKEILKKEIEKTKKKDTRKGAIK